MNMESKAPWKTGPHRNPAATGPAQLFLRMGGHSLSLATDIGALEECLALERSSRADRPEGAAEGIQSPPAVPYCEFLTVRSLDGRLQAVCRLMRLDQEIPLGHPLKANRFRLSPLATAIRYSREGVLEMGAIAFAPGCRHGLAAAMIWTGTIRFLERSGLGFVIGVDSIGSIDSIRALGTPGSPGSGSGNAYDRTSLMEAYGLHPDLEVDAEAHVHGHARPAPFQVPALPVQRLSTRDRPAGLHAGLHAGLQEALRRGCRLACAPAKNPATGFDDLVWVASREMLIEGAQEDWRSAAHT